MKILNEFSAMEVATVVDTADLNYAPFSRKYVPGGAFQRLGVTRLSYPTPSRVSTWPAPAASATPR